MQKEKRVLLKYRNNMGFHYTKLQSKYKSKAKLTLYGKRDMKTIYFDEECTEELGNIYVDKYKNGVFFVILNPFGYHWSKALFPVIINWK